MYQSLTDTHPVHPSTSAASPTAGSRRDCWTTYPAIRVHFQTTLHSGNAARSSSSPASVTCVSSTTSDVCSNANVPPNASIAAMALKPPASLPLTSPRDLPSASVHRCMKSSSPPLTCRRNRRRETESLSREWRAVMRVQIVQGAGYEHKSLKFKKLRPPNLNMCARVWGSSPPPLRPLTVCSSLHRFHSASLLSSCGPCPEASSPSDA